MAYRHLQGPRLPDLFDERARAATRQTMRDVAAEMGDAMLEAARAATPSRTGKTARAWTRSHVERHPDGGYTVTISNASPLAHLLEHGTDPHRLAPDDAEALDTPEGPRASADHPGARAFHMTAQAVHEAEALLEARSQQLAREWAARLERRD